MKIDKPNTIQSEKRPFDRKILTEKVIKNQGQSHSTDLINKRKQKMFQNNSFEKNLINNNSKIAQEIIDSLDLTTHKIIDLEKNSFKLAPEYENDKKIDILEKSNIVNHRKKNPSIFFKTIETDNKSFND